MSWNDNKQKFEHPSYGMINISRFSGQRNFFGSSIQHGGGISISISKGDIERDINRDWYHSGKEMIRIEMSYTQFAEMVTCAMNTQGVPCTIIRKDNKSFDSPPFINKRVQLQKEFDDTMKEQSEKLEELHKRINELSEKKGTISKKEIRGLQGIIYKVHQDIKSNIPYMSKCWEETMQKVTTEAKAEVEGFVETKIRQVGMENLRELTDIKILENSENLEIESGQLEEEK